ncbi:hypothetical protein L3Q70_04655 [Pseudoalteromonas sp. CF6-2]|uniref:hypothetical protein n=1 Tax=Pseudoalteromonas sp. CF6-2 TaxID=562716 RepID=UPI001F17AE66|nr:hypothetical protein L3Q70_04655 [Pseudoalteromonas sp. CF6-2]
MKLLYSPTNALVKWLKEDLLRLPTLAGKQSGVNVVKSDSTFMCWEADGINNQYKSYEKTIIVCTANSRFIFYNCYFTLNS